MTILKLDSDALLMVADALFQQKYNKEMYDRVFQHSPGLGKKLFATMLLNAKFPDLGLVERLIVEPFKFWRADTNHLRLLATTNCQAGEVVAAFFLIDE